MNIVRVTRAFIPLRDGISHHTYYLSKHQVALGHQVTILQPHHPTGIRDGIQIVNISLGRLTERYGSKYVTALFAVQAGLQIRQIHRQLKVDLIHAHGDIIEASILKLVAYQLGIPLLMTMHSNIGQQPLNQVIAPLVWRFIDQIIVVSQEIAETMKGWGLPGQCLHVISSGIEFKRFACTRTQKEEARQKLGIPANSFVAIGVGRLHPMKGFRYLIEAASMLSVESMQIYIIGGGSLELEFRSIAANIPNLKLVGSQSHENIIDYLFAADIFVLPSVDLPGQGEGTPTALMEAMAAALPVIITDSGGGKYLVRDGENGFVVPQADASALAAAIRRLLQDQYLREKMSAANREIAKSKDWRLIAAQVCEVYNLALSQG